MRALLDSGRRPPSPASAWQSTAVAPKKRLLVLASTFPRDAHDGTPAFVRDLAAVQGGVFDTLVLVPRVPGAARTELMNDVEIRRFAYFPRRWESLASGAIIENLRARKGSWGQVLPFLVSEMCAVRRAIREHRPDVVHVHWMIPQGLAAFPFARGIPWLVTTLGGDVYALRDPVSRAAKRQILRRASAVTTMNSDMRDRLISLGAQPCRTQVVPMGAAITEIRELAHGTVRDPRRILFVGRLVEKKGLGVLLDALRSSPIATSWAVDIVGDGPLRRDLEARAAGLPVRFLGQLGRPDLAQCYAASGIVAMPSVTAASGDQDGLPVALLEAMGLGCAVVASDLPGIRDVVEHGVSGLLVPPGDPAALSAALTSLLANPELRARVGAAASRAADSYSVEAIGARYVAILEEIANPHG